MPWTGLVVFAFLAFHILHFTLGQVQPHYFHVMDPEDRWTRIDVHPRLPEPGDLCRLPARIALLALHLGHGAASWLQSLGLRHPKYPADRLGPALAIFLFVGYMVPPTAVLTGILQLPGS